MGLRLVTPGERLPEGPKANRGFRLRLVRALQTPEPAPEQTLACFKTQYKRWAPEHRSKCSWEEIEARLTANNNHFLRLAEVMEGGGILFGVDAEGNPLVADGGSEPIMTGMNYADTREAVHFSRNEKDERTPTGYEMFPCSGNSGNYRKSPEIITFEAFTGDPFVRPLDKMKFCSSWLESGDTPARALSVGFVPGISFVGVDSDPPQFVSPSRGVRRLLRIKKAV